MPPVTYSRHPLTKVPEVTVYFWIVKVLTTGMGEATSDYLVHRLGPVPAVGIGFVMFVVSMALQFAVRRYRTWVYWFAVVMVAVFGTMAADVLHVGLGIPYLVSTGFFAMVLAIIFTVWYRAEGTLSIHSIYTRRRELFYWATVVTTFALGTAAGDLTAKTVGLGYLGSGFMFAAVIAVPGLAYWAMRRGAVAAFWAAYIVTRPLGASFADWLGWGHRAGGLGLGLGTVSVGSALLIVALVTYLAVSHKDAPRPARARAVMTGRHRAAPQPREYPSESF